MKRLVFIVLFLVSSCHLFAQFPSELWHEGSVVLLKGDTLEGLVKYDLETDIVQFTIDKRTLKTFSARKLLHFEIFDGTSNRYRQFYVLPYSLTGGYKAPIIFELMYEGKKLTMLSREAIEYQVTNYPYAVAGSYTRQELVYTNFFLTDEGEIVKFQGKKKDLLRGVMSKRASDIKKFLKTNRIKVERRPDLVKVVAYYNSLFEETN